MFSALKNKLKSWFSKAEEPEKKEEKKPKKIKAKAPKDEKAEEIKKQAEKVKKKLEKQEVKKEKPEEISKPEGEITGEVLDHTKGGPEKSEPASDKGGHLTKTEEQTIPETPKETKPSFFDKFRTKLTEEKFEELFQELEMILLQNNVAYEVVEKIKTDFKENLIGKNLSGINLEEELKKSLNEILINPPDFIAEIRKTLTQKQPFIILLAGINGSGKTTTTAKLVHLLKKESPRFRYILLRYIDKQGLSFQR